MTIKRQYFIGKEWRTTTHVLTWLWHRWYRTEYEHDICGIDDGQNLFLLKVRIWYWNVPHDKHKAMESNRLYSGHLDFYRPDDEDSSRICFIPQLDDVGTLKHFKIYPEPDQMVLIWSIVEEQHFHQAMLLSFFCFKNRFIQQVQKIWRWYIYQTVPKYQLPPSNRLQIISFP